jgi:hypothetical protein
MSWDVAVPADNLLVADVPSSIRAVKSGILNDSTMSAGDSTTPVTEAAIKGYVISGSFTMANKTLAAPVLVTPQIDDSNSSHQYIVGVANLSADQSVAFPLLSAADTFVFAEHAQTLKNKTISTPTFQGACAGASSIGSAVLSAGCVGSAALAASAVNATGLSSAIVASTHVTGVLGVYSAGLNSNSVYQAATDGFAIATGSGNPLEMKAYAESTSACSTQRLHQTAAEGRHATICMPVRKGEYWLIASVSSSIQWIPLGV